MRAVDPPKSREYKEQLQTMARLTNPKLIADTPLDVGVWFVLPIPQSWSKKKKERAVAGEIMPDGRPDLDNYIKAVLDALNGVVWEDDSAIVEITARKVYGEKPMVRISVYGHDMDFY